MKKAVRFASLIAIVAVANTILFSQETNPYEIIKELKTRLETIHDYQADIEIEVDVDFINVPVKHAIIYFKQPDKVKFKSDEFIMIPKKGFNNQLTALLNEPYNAIYIGEEIINERINHVIKVVPLGKNPGIILATCWIAENDFRLEKTESITRDEGMFTISFDYRDEELVLPDEMIISFSIENMQIPLNFIGKSEGNGEKNTEIEHGKQTGTVIIRFSNYIINQGITDAFFEEKMEE